MTRSLVFLTAMFLVPCSLHPGFAATGATSVPASKDSQADLRARAEKACNDALDQDHFKYDTMDECVADTAARFRREQAKS